VTAHNKLQQRLGYSFSDPELLNRALTHRSHTGRNYERLEFLGDSILNFIIAEHLFHQFPAAREGQLSRLRARMVRRDTLADIAREWQLGDFLIMGSGELKSGGFERASILSDVLEAIIGGIYLEAGMAVVAERIVAWFETRLQVLTLDRSQKDPKSLLQEYLQAKQCPLPEYSIIGVEGKSHDQVFTVECVVTLLAEPVTGVASSRRDAEQLAARQALASLGVNFEIELALTHYSDAD
jgi:ribonuclease III